MSTELSVADSEYIYEHFADLTDGPFANLSSALRDLAAMPEAMAPSRPPMMPSQVTQAVRSIGRGAKRTSAIVVAAVSAVAATTIAAAALTGVGPKPVVNFAKSTVKAIENVTKKIFSFVPSSTTSQDLKVSENAPTQGTESVPVPVESAPQNSDQATLPTPSPANSTHPVAPQPTPARTSHEATARPNPTISSHESETNAENDMKSSTKVETNSDAKQEAKTETKSESSAEPKGESVSTAVEKKGPETKAPVVTKTSAPTEGQKAPETKGTSENTSENSKD